MSESVKNEIEKHVPLFLRIIWIVFSVVAVLGLITQLVLSKQVLDIKNERQALEDRRELFGQEIENKTARLQEIQVKVSTHEPQLEKMVADRAKVSGLLIAVTKELDETQTALQSAKEIYSAILVNQQEAEVQLTLLSQQHKKIQAELDLKSGRLDETKVTLQDSESRTDGLAGREQALRKSIMTLGADVASLMAKKNIFEFYASEAEVKKAEQDSLTASVASMQKEYSELSVMVNTLTDSRDTLRSKVSALNAEIANAEQMKTRLTALSAEITAKNDELSLLRTEKQRLSVKLNQLAQYDGYLGSLQKLVSDQQGKLASLKMQILAAEDASSQLALAKSKAVLLESDISQKIGALNVLNETLQSKREELGRLTQQINQAQSSTEE